MHESDWLWVAAEVAAAAHAEQLAEHGGGEGVRDEQLLESAMALPRTTNQREPDMILTAESGWSWGDIGYGPDRKAQRRREIDEYRAEEGLEPVDWSGE